jgi:DNA repair protein RecN (Recombination protein N)
MLLELKIHNLAIIESVSISFGPGLNVITGETGAGKSILLAALDMLLGGKCDRTMIRTGEQEAWAEAVFECEDNIINTVREWGIAIEPGEPLALRRVVQVNGRSRSYINSLTASVQMLRQLSPYLLDFGRQHEQSLLMTPDKHLELLDRYAGIAKERASVEACYRRVVSLLREHQELQNQSRSRAERMEFLNFQRQAISAVDPQPGEENALTQELAKIATAEKRRKLAQRIEQALYSRDGDCVRERLAETNSLVKELTGLDEGVKHVLNDLQNALIAVEEGAHSMQIYQKSVRVDGERMTEIHRRLDQIIKLQQKYGGSFAAVMARIKEIDQERSLIANQERRLKELDKIIAEARAELYRLCLPLSEKRQEAAHTLSSKIEQELAGLAMVNSRFQVNFSPLATESDNNFIPYVYEQKNVLLGPWGMENCNFLLSANTGEDLRRLERVASGGELSRIMLGLKHVLSSAFPVDTFVFDEIDAGVAGAAASMVAQKLRSIVREAGGAAQIITISHTPQVAAEADHHFCVQKQTKDGRTVSQVTSMKREERILEIARMLAGNQSMEQALALAQELVPNPTERRLP